MHHFCIFYSSVNHQLYLIFGLLSKLPSLIFPAILVQLIVQEVAQKGYFTFEHSELLRIFLELLDPSYVLLRCLFSENLIQCGEI